MVKANTFCPLIKTMPLLDFTTQFTSLTCVPRDKKLGMGVACTVVMTASTRKRRIEKVSCCELQIQHYECLSFYLVSWHGGKQGSVIFEFSCSLSVFLRTKNKRGFSYNMASHRLFLNLIPKQIFRVCLCH